MADTRHRLSPNLAAVLVLALLAGILLLWQRPWESSDPSTVSTALPSDAGSVLTAQLRSLSEAGSETQFVEATGSSPRAQAFGRRTWTSLQALGVRDLELRYVSGGDVADRADGTGVAVAEISWRAGRASGLGDVAIHRAAVRLRVAPQDDGRLSIVGAEPRAGLLPVWLVGAVTVERGPGTTVVTVGGGDADAAVQRGAAARIAVDDFVPDAAGDVVLVSPRTEMQMARIVGQPVDAVAQIAAVTTRLDDRGSRGSRNVIVLNPRVFATMDQRAAQVVVTHEATHLLTGAVGTRAETWVVEGFADFVALRDDTAPLSVSAGQILAQVDAGRLPTSLPSSSDYASTGRGLGAVYESSWMIFRLLGERYGDADVLRFYTAVLDGRPLARALDDAFGLTERQLTAQWRAYLTKSASTVS